MDALRSDLASFGDIERVFIVHNSEGLSKVFSSYSQTGIVSLVLCSSKMSQIAAHLATGRKRLCSMGCSVACVHLQPLTKSQPAMTRLKCADRSPCPPRTMGSWTSLSRPQPLRPSQHWRSGTADAMAARQVIFNSHM